jgi:hypothetical protein
LTRELHGMLGSIRFEDIASSKSSPSKESWGVGQAKKGTRTQD